MSPSDRFSWESSRNRQDAINIENYGRIDIGQALPALQDMPKHDAYAGEGSINAITKTLQEGNGD
jgi:hypothetical protein